MNPDVRLSRRAMDVVDIKVWGLNEHDQGGVEWHMEVPSRQVPADFRVIGIPQPCTDAQMCLESDTYVDPLGIYRTRTSLRRRAEEALRIQPCQYPFVECRKVEDLRLNNDEPGFSAASRIAMRQQPEQHP
jgi:hypothetical protein